MAAFRIEDFDAAKAGINRMTSTVDQFQASVTKMSNDMNNLVGAGTNGLAEYSAEKLEALKKPINAIAETWNDIKTTLNQFITAAEEADAAAAAAFRTNG